MKTQKTVRGYAVFFLAMVVAALGISLITKSGLGTSPVTSFAYVLSFIFPMSLGFFTFLVNGACLIGQVLLLGRDFDRWQLLQLPATFVFSACIDLDVYLLSSVPLNSYPARIGILLCGCAVLGLGVALEVVSGALLLPAEGIIKAVVWRWKVEFGRAKTTFDLLMVLSACLLSLLCLGRVAGIREGTVIAALTVGSFARFFTPKVSFLTAPTLRPLPQPVGKASGL